MSNDVVNPAPEDPNLTERVEGIDHNGHSLNTLVPVEQPLTLYLNSQEIVTVMTIGDYPEELALGFFLNQNMLTSEDVIVGTDFDSDLGVIVVRTERETDYEEKLSKKIRTSGCAQGTSFGDIMENFDCIKLPETKVKTSWLYSLSQKINATPSLYLSAGAIHGSVLCKDNRPLAYMEDVGRHNAVDKIAGHMFKQEIRPEDKILYTTGRLTSEMVLKTVQMGIPILISRSGFTAWGVQLARQANLTLIGRARGKRFVALSGTQRLDFDVNPEEIPAERTEAQRKAGQ